MLPRNNADVTHCEKTLFYFQNKAAYRAEDRPTDICLKMTFTWYFFWRQVKTKNCDEQNIKLCDYLFCVYILIV